MNTHIQWLFREINVCCLFLPPPSKNHKHLPKSPALKSVNTLHCLSSPEIVFVNEQKNCLSVILCLHMTASSKTEHKERSSADIVHIWNVFQEHFGINVSSCHICLHEPSSSRSYTEPSPKVQEHCSYTLCEGTRCFRNSTVCNSHQETFKKIIKPQLSFVVGDLVGETHFKRNQVLSCNLKMIQPAGAKRIYAHTHSHTQVRPTEHQTNTLYYFISILQSDFSYFSSRAN